MNDFLIYLFKVSLITSILYGLYWLVFSKTTFHTINRFFLLLIIPFALVCPILEVSNSFDHTINDYSQWISNYESLFPAGTDQVKPTAPGPSLSINFFLLVIYGTGVLLFLFHFLNQIRIMLRLRNMSTKVRWDTEHVYLTDNKRAPFSFFGWIFLPFNNNSNGDDLIFEHEKVHAKQFHSLDIIIAELFCVAFWFNPIVFLLKNSLKTVHEYLADYKVIQNGNPTPDYLKLLITNIEMKRLPGITNNFNCVNIKKRIEMITKNKSSKFRKFSYLLLLPVLAVIMQAFSTSPLDDENKPNIVPIKQGSKYEIASGYGMKMHPILKKKKMHSGIDFKAALYTPVIAPANGVVIKAERKGQRGNWILIKHNDAYSTSYSHLSKFNVDAGENVTQGDIIGYVGNTGLSTGPHLHYEVLKNGEPDDPEEYFE